MNEKDILNSIKKSVEQAPIDLLDKIKAQPRVKMLKHDDITRQEENKNFYFRILPYISAAAVFIFAFLGWNFQKTMPDSYIYLDVNPSIEIVTNRQDKVIDIKSYNEEGRMLTRGLNYKDKTVYEVTEKILDEMLNKKHLDKGKEYVLLSVYNKDTDKAEQQKKDLDKKIHEHLEANELQPIVLCQKLDNTSTIRKYAKKHGISVSKMTFIRNLIILNPELKAEDLVDLTIRDLVNLSQGMGLDLEKIIDTTDTDKINNSDKDLEQKLDDVSPQEIDYTKPIISLDKAKSIARSRVGGKIISIDFDEDDLEYEVEIISDHIEYEITIDAKTGKVIDVEKDD